MHLVKSQGSRVNRQRPGRYSLSSHEPFSQRGLTRPSIMRLLSSPFPLLLILICLLQPTLSAKSTATSFCKCICFNNSTIIALNPPPSSTRAARPHNLDVRSPAVHAGAGLFPGRDTDDEEDRAAAAASASAAAAPKEDDGDDANDHPPAAQPHKHHKLTCADCTRAFCLDYNLPICKNAGEEDVFTTCFRMSFTLSPFA